MRNYELLDRLDTLREGVCALYCIQEAIEKCNGGCGKMYGVGLYYVIDHIDNNITDLQKAIEAQAKDIADQENTTLNKGSGNQGAVCGTITIPVSSWNIDSNAEYPVYYDLLMAGVTDADRADVLIAPNSAQAANVARLCPVCETLDGKVRFRASAVPSQALQAVVFVTKVKE